MQAIRRRLLLTPVFFYTRARRRLGVRTRAATALLVILFAVLSGVALNIGRPAQTEAYTVSNTINFQARLETAAGAIVPDGNYNVQFKLYNVSSGGSALWTESYLNSASQGITVANGYLTANLNSINNSWGAVNWNQQLYLTMNIGGTTTGAPTYDGEMSPRLKMTALPYAFQAGQLADTGGVGSTLGWTTQTTARSILLPDEAGTLCIQNSTNCGFATSSGSGNYIQNQNVSPQAASFNISGSGTIGGGLTANGTVSLNGTGSGTTSIGSGSAGAITLQSNSTIGLTAGTSLTLASTGANAINLNPGGSSNTGVVVKPTTNSTVAFQVQSVAGNTVFGVDTSNLKVNVQNSTLVTQYIDTPNAPSTISRTSRVSASSSLSYGTGSYTPAGTFSPAANRLLLAYVNIESASGQAMATNGSDITLSGGSLTWVPVTGRYLSNTGWGVGYRVFYAYTTASAPTNMQVTADAGTFNINKYEVSVDEMAGVDAVSPVAGAVSGSRQSTNNNTWTATLGVAPESADWSIITGSIDQDTATDVWSAQSGWTKLYSPTPAPSATVQYRTASTSTTVNYGLGTIQYSNADTAYGGFILRAANGNGLSVGATNAVSVNVGNASSLLTLQGTVNAVSGLQVGGTSRITSAGQLQNVSFGSATSALVTDSSGNISAALGATSGQCLVSNGTSTAPSFQTCPGGGGVTGIGTIDSQTKSLNGAVISSGNLVLQSADASFPGLVTTGTQTFAGAKTFNGAVTLAGQQNIIQPASNLTAGQTNVAQTFTNASSTGGTVQGFGQTITIANTSTATTTNGIALNITDNGTGGNVDNGILINFNGSSTNGSRNEFGINISATHGSGILSVTSGSNGGASGRCNGVSIGVGICAGGTSSSNDNGGVYGYTQSRATTNIYDPQGSGVYGLNAGFNGTGTTAGTGNAGSIYAGVKGIANLSNAAAYTALGVLGQARGGAGATVYGGYFALDSASTATLGSALFATNSTAGANILQIQDGNVGPGSTAADVFTIGDGGVATFKNTTSTNGFVVQDANSRNYIQADTSGGNLYLGNTAAATTIQIGNTSGGVAQTINIGNNAAVSSSSTVNIGSQVGASPVTIKSGTGGITLSPVGTSGSGVMVKPANDSTAAFQIQNATVSGATTLFAADTANLRINITGDTNAGTRFGNRLFSDNFESGAVAFWDQGGSNITAQSAVVHDGIYAAQANLSGSPGYASASVNSGTVYFRSWVYVASQTSSLIGLLNVQDTSGQSFVVGRLSSGNLEFWNGITNVHTNSGAAFSTGAWHLVEMRVTTGNPTGTSQVWLDGTQITNLTSQNNGTNNLGTVKIGDSTGGRTFNAYFDDVAADTVSTGTASSLNVDDSFHVGGTAAFGNSVLIQPASDSSTAFQIRNSVGQDLLVADTAHGQVSVSSGVAGGTGGGTGGVGAGAAGDMGGGGGGAINSADGTANACTGGTGGQGVDISGLFSVVSGLGYATTGPGAGYGCSNPGGGNANGGSATGFGSGGGGAGYWGGMGGAGMYGGGGGGAAGESVANRIGGAGGQGVLVISPTGGGSNSVQASGTSYTVPAGVSSVKVWAIGAGGGGAGGTNNQFSAGGGGGAGAVVYSTFAVVPGQIITYSLGTAGAGGTNTANGSAGGTTTVTVGNVTLTATGGAGGQYNNGLTAAGGTYTNSGGTTIFNVQDVNGTSLLKADITNLQVTVGGNLDAQSFSVNGTPGASVSCAAGSLLQNATVVNGLVTGGSCTGSSYAIAYNSAAQSIPNVAVTVVGLNSERQDTDNYHNPASNNSRLTAPSAGYYHITANWAWDPVTTGNRYADIILNNTTVIAADRRVAAGYAGEGSLSIDYYLNAGDYVQFRVYQDTGAALNLTAASNSPVFSIFRVSANPGGASALTVGTLDGQVKSSNGAVISGGAIYLQSADASNPGLITTGSQTLAGAKTFTGALTASGGLSVSTSVNVNTTGLTLNSSTGTFDLEGTGGADLTVGHSTSTSGSTSTISVKGARNGASIFGQLDFYNYDSAGTGADFVGARVAGRQNGTNNAALEFYTAKTNTLSTNPVLRLDADGAATFRNSTNGTGGLVIQNSTGGTLLSFDTAATNGHLTIGGVGSTGNTDKIELVRSGTTVENSIRLTNLTGSDWKMFQPTGTDNLAFTSDAFTTNVLTLNISNGSALFKNNADSTTGFQIQSSTASSSTPLFTVDTQNKNLQVGSAATDGTAVFTILDSYNTAADPTGINGAMYYNTAKNVFRCYENGAWKDCLSHHVIELGSDVASTASTSFQAVTGLSFSMTSGSNYRFHAYLNYTTSATSIGLRAAVSGPASPTQLSYQTVTGLSTTGSGSNGWFNTQSTYDAGTSSTSSISTTVGNGLIMDGFIRPSANGTLQVDFAPETATANGIVIKAGSTLEWW